MKPEARPIADEDIDQFFDHLNDPDIAVMAGTVPHPVDRAWAVARLEKRRAEEAAGRAAQRGLYEGTVLVGDFSYFTNEEGAIEIGYAINRHHRGRGHATIAAQMAVGLVRTHGHAGPIHAGYAKNNPASGRVLEKIGFVPNGEGVVQSLGRGGDMPVWRVIYRDDVTVRPSVDSDMPALFAHQNDAEAHWLAAGGMARADEAAFRAHVAAARDKGAIFLSICHEGLVAGYLGSFDRFGKREVTYWLGRSFWGQGIATRALALWLAEAKVPEDGLYARVAKDHAASVRVLEKCDFVIVGEDRYHSDSRDAVVEEWLYRLQA